MNQTPEARRKKCKELLQKNGFLRVMEAVNGLSGRIVEQADADGKSFDAMWFSSLCDATLRGMPDNETVPFQSKLQTLLEIFAVTTKPMIFDADTGGPVEELVEHIRALERIGVSAIVLEDKTGVKRNSLFEDPSLQLLEDPLIFADKIKKACEARQTKDFLIFARIESLVAGCPMSEALSRADLYVEAGADGIMIHSNHKDGKEICAFLQAFREKHPDIPVMLVPTTYAQFSEQELREQGAQIIIYANHFLRSTYQMMKQVAGTILQDEKAEKVNDRYCCSCREIISLFED